MAITFGRSYITGDKNAFSTLELAQAHELKKLIEEIPRETEEGLGSVEVANFLVQNSETIVDLLSLNKSSRPRARKSMGGKKPRKTAPETPELPVTTAK